MSASAVTAFATTIGFPSPTRSRSVSMKPYSRHISGFKSNKGEWRPTGQGFEKTIEIRNGVLDIQYGRAADTFGWLSKVA